jgi:hypothetical protein
MTVTLTTCTTFNTGPQVINYHSVLKHLTLPLGRNNGIARFANKSNSNFPFQECVASKGQATSTADHLFLRPGENRLDKHPQNPWEAIDGCETGMPLMPSWPKDGYSNSHGPKTLWLLLTPSQGCALQYTSYPASPSSWLAAGAPRSLAVVVAQASSYYYETTS